MSSASPSLFLRLLKIGAVVAVVLAVVVWPVAWWLASQAVTVQFIAPFDEATVEVNRFTYEDDPTGADADIIAIYGSVSGEPERIVFADTSKILHPQEKPALALYAKEADDNPIQVQLVYFLAKAVSIGAAVGAVVLAGLLTFLRRRRARATAAGDADAQTA